MNNEVASDDRADYVEARGQEAHKALASIATLALEEERYLQLAPLGETGLRAVTEAYGQYLAWKISRP